MPKSWWLAIAATLAGAAWALDPPRPAPAPATEQPQVPQPEPEQQPGPAAGAEAPPPASEPEPEPEPADVPPEEETLPPLPPDARRTGPTPQRFDPSEEVRADFPVSFPPDI